MSSTFIQYQDINIRPAGRKLIDQVNGIIAAYRAQNYSLTLRQVYYQLVSKNAIENNERSYKSLGVLVSNGRLAGLIDWLAIEDRTRFIRSLSHWETPQEIIESAANSYHIDLWQDQPCYIESWVEKDALIGIVEQSASRYDVSSFSCRGYVSSTEMWEASRRYMAQRHKHCILLHLGDHDPSGLDMTRDISERLQLFGACVDVQRIALNVEQVERYNPPPNPAKTTDRRFDGYVKQYGPHSWELDALEPGILATLITDNIEMNLDQKLYQAMLDQEEYERQRIQRVADTMRENPEIYV